MDILSFDLLPKPSTPTTMPTATGKQWSVDSISNSTPPDRDPTRGLRTAIAVLEQEILPQAIGLTDAFGFTDYELDR